MKPDMTAVILNKFPGSTVTPRHPARFRADHLEWIIENVPCGRVLDPFCGVGTIHELRSHGYMTEGVELEPNWAVASPHTTIGDATDLPWGNNQFDAVVTSPVYGNRMSDSHNAQDASRRNTYTHALGEPLLPNNAGKMHFHQKQYKKLHYKAWVEAHRVLRPGGIMAVNVKNFIKGGQETDVVGWHKAILNRIFGGVATVHRLEAPGLRHGQNHAARVTWEAFIEIEKGP